MANPPITIGELIDVPAPGSAIASAWTQEATQRIVHRFATAAARDAQYTNRLTGALAYTIDTKRLCMWDGVGWVILREEPTAVAAGSPILTVWPHSNGAASTPIGVAGTWASGATVSAEYRRVAGLCHVGIRVALAAGGLSIGQVNLPFQFTGAANNDTLKVAFEGTQRSPGFIEAWGSQSFAIFGLTTASGAPQTASCTASFPIAFKAGDIVSITGVYPLLDPHDAYYMNP